jgi:hypothetical protein
MDGLTLLQHARAVGLRVSVDGDLLRVRGPRHAEPVALQLIANKPAVLAVLLASGCASPSGDSGDSDSTPKNPESQRVLSTVTASPENIAPGALPADWHQLWDERAAIMEYDGGLSRELAEARALDDVLATIRREESLTIDGRRYIQDGKRWRVESQRGIYFIDTAAQRCSCPGFRFHGHCRHLRTVTDGFPVPA